MAGRGEVAAAKGWACGLVLFLMAEALLILDTQGSCIIHATFPAPAAGSGR